MSADDTATIMGGLTVMFQAGEKVLCYQGGMIYEAKCQKVRHTEKHGRPQIEYRAHYSGWNKNWDEWVTSQRMLKYNAENLAVQKQLVEKKKSRKGKIASHRRSKTGRD